MPHQQGGTAGHGERTNSHGRAVPHGERTAIKCGTTAVSVGTTKRQIVATQLGQLAGAADDLLERQIIAAVNDQVSVVDDSARPKRSYGAVVADLQCAGADGGATGEGVGASQNRGAGSSLNNRSRTA